MSTIRRIFVTITILSLLVVGVGFTARPALAANCTQYYTVRWGDTLAQIARYYGTTWQYLAKINHLPNPSKIYAGTVLCVSTTGDYKPPKHGKGYYPTFSIVSVTKNKTVTIHTYNLPPDEKFNVYMGPMGSNGYGGYKVDSFNSGNGGSKKYTFDIPSELKGDYQIAIWIKSPASGYYAYNWFYNNKSGGGGGTGGGGTKYWYTGFPTFSILSVVRNDSVTIQAYNLPESESFKVTMGPMGTKGIGGYNVGTVNSGGGGSKQYTFDIPSALKGSYQISIRMYSPSSGYFAYNWFYNNTAVDP